MTTNHWLSKRYHDLQRKEFANGNERKMKETMKIGVEVDKKGNVTVQGKKNPNASGRKIILVVDQLAVENIPADALIK
jgi:hypothetical protein